MSQSKCCTYKLSTLSVVTITNSPHVARLINGIIFIIYELSLAETAVFFCLPTLI